MENSGFGTTADGQLDYLIGSELVGVVDPTILDRPYKVDAEAALQDPDARLVGPDDRGWERESMEWAEDVG